VNRRGFLGTLAAALTGAVLDPERLLWVPGQRTIFLPPVVHFNTLITPEWVMREVGRMLVNNIQFAASVNRSYDDAWTRGVVRLPSAGLVDLNGRYLVN